MAHIDLIDVAWSDLDLDREGVRIRHDQHDLLARRDHAANGVNRELVNAAGLGSPDVDAIAQAAERREGQNIRWQDFRNAEISDRDSS